EGKDAEPAALARKTERTTEEEDEAERQIPVLTEGERLRLVAQEGQAAPGLTPKQHFTQPPPRYNEALLIRELEEKGIGRPSTYASIISTIQERRYVEKADGRFVQTETGITVNDFLGTGTAEPARDPGSARYAYSPSTSTNGPTVPLRSLRNRNRRPLRSA